MEERLLGGNAFTHGQPGVLAEDSLDVLRLGQAQFELLSILELIPASCRAESPETNLRIASYLRASP